MSLGHKWQWLIIEKPLSYLAFKESNPFNAYLNEKKLLKEIYMYYSIQIDKYINNALKKILKWIIRYAIYAIHHDV